MPEAGAAWTHAARDHAAWTDAARADAAAIMGQKRGHQQRLNTVGIAPTYRHLQNIPIRLIVRLFEFLDDFLRRHHGLSLT